MKTKRRTGEYGGFKVEVEYIVLNDGGELRLIAWEVSPNENQPPDLILDKELGTLTSAEHHVDWEIQSHIAGMIRTQIVCHNCED